MLHLVILAHVGLFENEAIADGVLTISQPHFFEKLECVYERKPIDVEGIF